MEENISDDKSTQVYPRDLMANEEDICCANATCSMRIPYEKPRPPDILVSAIKIPESMLFSPEELARGTKDNYELQERVVDRKILSPEQVRAWKVTNNIEEASLDEHSMEMIIKCTKPDLSEERKAEEETSKDTVKIEKRINEDISWEKEDNIEETSSGEQKAKITEPPVRSEEVMVSELPDEQKTEEKSVEEHLQTERKIDEVTGRKPTENQNLQKKESEKTSSKVDEIFNRKPNWRYDGIDRPHDSKTVRLSENEAITSTFEYEDSEATQSTISEQPGTSFWGRKFSDFSNRFSDVISAKKRYPVVENEPVLRRSDSKISDVLSAETMNFPGNYTPTALITRNRIVDAMLEGRLVVQEELIIFREQLKKESIFLSSLFIFLIYYIIYFVSYCGIVHKCFC